MYAPACSSASGRQPSAWQYLHVERVRSCAPVWIARRDEDVPACVLSVVEGWQKWTHVLWLFGVVENDEPAFVLTQIIAHRLHDDVLVARVTFGELQRLREEREVGRDARRRLGAHEPNDVVIGGEAIRVLDRELCLADAAQAVNRLRQRGRRARCERGAELLEQFGASRKVGIAGKGDVPNGGKRARES